MTLRREFFATAEFMHHLWALTKDGRTARCDLWSHERGCELRLTISGDSFPRTQVCRSPDQFPTVAEHWRTTLEQQGWTALAGYLA